MRARASSAQKPPHRRRAPHGLLGILELQESTKTASTDVLVAIYNFNSSLSTTAEHQLQRNGLEIHERQSLVCADTSHLTAVSSWPTTVQFATTFRVMSIRTLLHRRISPAHGTPLPPEPRPRSLEKHRMPLLNTPSGAPQSLVIIAVAYTALKVRWKSVTLPIPVGLIMRYVPPQESRRMTHTATLLVGYYSLAFTFGCNTTIVETPPTSQRHLPRPPFGAAS